MLNNHFRALSISCWLVLLIVGLSGKELVAQEKPLTYRIDFRDGTSLRAEFPAQDITWSNIARDGAVTQRKLELSQVKRIRLVPVPSTQRVAKIRNLLSQLGSDDYHKRLEAQIKLAETGKEFEQIIKQYVPGDAETRWRIEKVKEKLAAQEGGSTADTTFDVLQLTEEGKAFDGELMGEGFEVVYKGQKIKLNRGVVAAITDEPLRSDYDLTVKSGGGVRQTEYPDANGTMPPGMKFIDFEHLPDGAPVRSNQDLMNAYASEGVLFETSYKESYVGAQLYSFAGGRGGSYSIANNDPTYEGVITIRFCVPGNPRFAAGTKYVSFNVSHVNAEGTFFEAYNPQGQLITKFLTDETGTDYLGFRSEVPIAKVVVRPNVEVDPDFAIDDLFFETPTALLESGNPKYFSVVTTSGERLQAESVGLKDEALELKNLSIGVESLVLPLDQVWVAIPPGETADNAKIPTSDQNSFCLMEDGTICLANMQGKTQLHFNGQQIGLNQLVAFWGTSQQLAAQPFEKIAAGNAMIFAEGKFFDLNEIQFGDKWLQTASIEELAKKAATETDTNEGVDLKDVTYGSSPCVYLTSTPVAIPKGSGVLYTNWGERYFFGIDEGYQLSLTADGIELSLGDNKQPIRWNQIRSIRFPK